MSFECWLKNGYKKYLNAKELSLKLSETEDEIISKPYEYKYEAKQMLNDLLEELTQFSDNHSNENQTQTQKLVLKLIFEYELGVIDCDTEEISSGHKHLQTCLQLLNDEVISDNKPLKCSLTLFSVMVTNQLGYIWCLRSDFESAERCLKDSETSYHYWSRSEDQIKSLLLDFNHVFLINPFKSLEILETTFDGNNPVVKKLEKAHTLTLYFLAQTYEKIGENSKSAVYCHSTLKRQYDYLESEDQLYDCIEWSLNAATLSQYFAMNSDFDAAKHHICCAKKVMNTYLGPENEKHVKAVADLNRIIVKYCLMILESSVSLLKNNELVDISKSTEFRPYLLNEPEVEQLEKSMPSFPIKDLNEAKQAFKYAFNCLTEAKAFFKLDERASDYIECIQDQSKLYQYLIPFDDNYERQCKMHKRRIDLLQDLISQISDQHFMGQCRQLEFELGEIYSQMIELKTFLMNKKPNEQQLTAAKKINSLIVRAISHFNRFIITFYQKSTNHLPQRLDDEYVRPILLSRFSIGRLKSKLITIDPREQLENWSQCESDYVEIRDYLNRNPEHKNQFEQELPLLEEMLHLIPGKLKIIMNSTVY